jgi:hypothetical protein
MLRFSAGAGTDQTMPRSNVSHSRAFTRERAVSRARMLLGCACALLGLALAGAAGARARAASLDSRAANAMPAVLPAPGSVARFAIADFDGDRRPDLARVQTGAAGAGTPDQTQYWIQLQLTRAGRQLIGVVAPFGGLRVAASDVNGDHAIDLVLSTAWLGRPVAILLNDGHGRFTAEKPSAFPGAFRPEARDRISHVRHARGTASAAQWRSSADAGMQAAYSVPQTHAGTYWNSAILPASSRLAQQGRAPPPVL